MDVNLKVKFCGVNLVNPFIVSQVPPNGELETIKSQLAAGWGGVLLRSASLNVDPKKQTAAKMRQNAPLYRGVDYEEKRAIDLGWIEPEVPMTVEEAESVIGILKEEYPDRTVIGSMVGRSRDEWLKVSRRLSQAGADIIECDFSIPAEEENPVGPRIADDIRLMEKAARYVRGGARNTPIMFKIPGMLDEKEQVVDVLKAADAEGINLFYEPKGVPGINLTNFVPFPNVGAKSTLSVMGGSGTKPYTLGVLAEWGKINKGLDVSALGGAYDWRDCVEYILMGARLIQFHGAVLQRGVRLVDDLHSGVGDYLNEKMVSSLDKLVGKSLPFFTTPDKLPRSGRVVAAIDDKVCIRCGICYQACENLGYHAISLNNQRKPSIDKKNCMGDGLCVASCPVFNCMSLRRVSSK
ncbi:MAG: 4Fe-4S dicluster domain-containing protein [Candidatus Glassbacteria bacterium]|nr:4Fe-4S dicluster domain-containing protein [Candidatus Glassbacteria bacterium]